MTLLTTTLLDTKAYDFSVLRYLWQSQVTQSGVVDKGDLLVTAKGSQPPMGVSVAGGAAWVRSTTGTRNGAYHVVNDASVDITLTAAHATLPRVDRIILRLGDTSDLGTASDNATLEAVDGTATVGATLVNLTGVTALPANSLTLGFVLVAATATTVAAASIGNLADPFGTAAGYAAVDGAVSGAPPAFATGRPAGFVPHANVFNSAAQSLTTATTTVLAMNSERIDNDGCHDLAVNNSRIIIQTPGLYAVTLNAAFAANATGYRTAGIRVNTATDVAVPSALSVGAGASTLVSVARNYRLGFGDYVAAIAYQNSGGGLNVEATATHSPELTATWVGP